MTLPLILLGGAALIAYKLWNWLWYKLSSGPQPLPFVDNLRHLKPLLVRCFTEWSEVYGPIFSIYFGSHLSIVVNSVALVREVLKDNNLQLAYRNRTKQINKSARTGWI